MISGVLDMLKRRLLSKFSLCIISSRLLRIHHDHISSKEETTVDNGYLNKEAIAKPNIVYMVTILIKYNYLIIFTIIYLLNNISN